MKPYGIQKAVDFLAAELAKQTWPSGEKLPPLADLAALAGVSKRTMWLAIAELKQKRLVCAKKGGRIYAGETALADTAFALRSPQRVTAMIERDIFAGHFASGKYLPISKELQARYGVSYTTIRSALWALARNQIVIPHRRKFLVPTIARKGFQSRVCLIWETGALEDIKEKSAREIRVIDQMERECSLADVILDFVPFNVDDPNGLKKTETLLAEQDDILGFVLHPISYHQNPGVMETYIALIRFLCGQKKPIAFLDENGNFTPPQPPGSNRQMRIFRIADRSAGGTVARMALAHGHTRIAYLSRFQNDLWAPPRLEGAMAEATRAGFAGAIFPFVMSSHFGIIDVLLDPAGLTREKFIAISLSPNGSTGIPEHIENEAAALFAFVNRHEARLRDLQKAAQSLTRIGDEQLETKAIFHARDMGMRWIQRDVLWLLLESLFERALADREITAWICANDDIAVHALAFLKRRRIRVPEDLSIIGFDNLHASFEAGLSSFDFNIPNIVQQILAFITHPNHATRASKEYAVEMPGFVVQRRSMAPSNKSSHT